MSCTDAIPGLSEQSCFSESFGSAAAYGNDDQYKYSSEAIMVPYLMEGRVHWDLGGFHASVSSNSSIALNQISQLTANGYIDDATGLLMFGMTWYNINIGQFFTARVVIEFSSSGAINQDLLVRPIVFFLGSIPLSWYLLFTLVIVQFVVQVRQLIFLRKSSMAWSIVEMASNVICGAHLALYALLNFDGPLKDGRVNSFATSSYQSEWEVYGMLTTLVRTMMGYNVLFILFLTFKTFRNVPRFSLPLRVVFASKAGPVLLMCVGLGSSFVAAVALGQLLMYGPFLEEFSTLMDSASRLVLT